MSVLASVKAVNKPGCKIRGALMALKHALEGDLLMTVILFLLVAAEGDLLSTCVLTFTHLVPCGDLFKVIYFKSKHLALVRRYIISGLKDALLGLEYILVCYIFCEAAWL